jgi:hypothetical protein
MMPGTYDVHFFEIGKESGTDFAIFVQTSTITNKSEAEARTLIDTAVTESAIPNPTKYNYLHAEGGKLDIDTNSTSNVICVFFLNGATESYFKDNEPILNLNVHRDPPKSGAVSGGRSYPSSASKPRWASFKIDRAKYKPANHTHVVDIVAVPFVLNIMNNDTECWPNIGHHTHSRRKQYGTLSHGGIHPDTPANVITFPGGGGL